MGEEAEVLRRELATPSTSDAEELKASLSPDSENKVRGMVGGIVRRRGTRLTSLEHPARGRLRRTVGAMTLVLGLHVAPLANPAVASPGDLDSSFGSGGTVASSFGVAAHDVAIQPDGRIVTAGYDTVPGKSVFAVARYLPNGDLDPTFGGDGTVTTDISCDSPSSASYAAYSKAVVVQRIDQPGGPVDKVLLAGYRAQCGADLAKWVLVRYEPDGSLDPTFGVAGVVKLQVGAGSSTGITDLALDAVGRLVAVGSVNLGTPALVTSEQFGVARFLPNGVLDPSFGEGGMTITMAGRYYSRPAAVALTTVEVGGAGVEAIILAGVADGNIALARYLPDGVLDPMFGANGVSNSVYSDSGAQDVAVQADGKLVVAAGDRLARFTSVGGLDGHFAGKGFAISGYWQTGVAVQKDGAIVASGNVTGADLPPRFAVARYRSDGSADPSFGGGGTVTTLIGGTYSKAHALALQPDGMIVLAGERPFKLARYQGAVLPPTVPSAPSLTAAGGKPKGVALSWTAPPNGGDPITGYRIYRGTASDGKTFLKAVGTVPSYKDADTIKGTTYYYAVRAVNAVGEGSASNEASASAN